MDLRTFLRPVRDAVIRLLELEDSSGKSLLNDSVLINSSHAAFSQIEMFLNRSIMYEERTEVYYYVVDSFRLRSVPVDITASISFKEYFTESEIDNSIFKVSPTGVVTFLSTPVNLFMYGFDQFTLPDTIEVTYTGGLTDVTKNYALFQGLISQTVANYKRRDMKGISLYAAGDKTIANTSDRGSVIQEVRDLLISQVFYGSIQM